MLPVPYFHIVVTVPAELRVVLLSVAVGIRA